MSDLIRIELRRAPWQPSSDALLLETYEFYDMPLAGLVRQGSSEYLFQCVEGADEPINLWRYSAITPWERAALEATPPETFSSSLRSMPQAGWSRLAIATDGLGIVDFEDSDDWAHGMAGALSTMAARLMLLADNMAALQAFAASSPSTGT